MLASARTGPQNYALQRRFGLDDHLWDKVEILPIPKLAGSEAQGFGTWYQQQFAAELPDKFDHHPGSLFLDLRTMGERWDQMDQLAEQASQHGLAVQTDHAKQLLQALHLFYTLQVWQAGGLFAVATLKKLLSFRARFTEQHGNSLALALKKHQPSLLGEWDNVVEFLAQDRFNLGFIQTVQQDGQAWLQIETAYLDYIVGPGSNRNIVQKALEELDGTQRQQLGLRLTPYNLASLLPHRIHDQHELNRLLRSLKALGLVPDVIGWNQIIHHCQGLALAQQALLQCKNNGVAPDVFSFSSLLDKATDLAQGQQILQAMREAGIAPNVVTFSSLLDKATDLAQGQQILQAMREAGIAPNVVTFSSLLDKATDLAQGQQILQAMREAGIAPDVVTWNSLLDKATDLAQGQQILQAMREAGIAPDVVTFSSLLDKATDLAQGQQILQTMREAGIAPNVVTFSSLLDKATDLAQGQQILQTMREAGIAPDVVTWNSLLNKAPNLAQGQQVLQLMHADKIVPDDVSYNTLLAKANKLADGLSVLNLMREAGQRPDKFTLHRPVQTSPNLARD